MTLENEKNYGFLSFLPLIIFLTIYIGSGLFFTYLGVENPFRKFPRHVALLIAIASAMIINRRVSIDKKIQVFSEGAGNPSVIMIGLIYLLAGGFQEAAKITGGVESIVNLGLTFIPDYFLVPGVFLITSIISTAIGTSTGTIAAMAPIALGIAEATSINTALVSSAVIGGAYLGDNLSIISDTTIAAAKGVGSDMKDKFKTNLFIAFPAAILAIIMYSIFNGEAVIINEIKPYSITKIFPYITVLFSALLGFNVVGVLFIGILTTGLIGFFTSSITFLNWITAIGNGMSNMFSITIVAILISGLISIIKYYGGINWIIDVLSKKIEKKQDAEYGLGIMAGLLSSALVNNTIAIIITAPIAKDIGKKYEIEPKRIASIIDIFACAFLALTPYDGGMLIITGLSNVSPLEVLKYSFYIFSLLIVTSVNIYFNKNKKVLNKIKKEGVDFL
ncbi:MAG: Na+/H+ antiporter NhaC family protein [Cetobacterium sp.]|uniref:Na+/H+ antiporter NhaC family protein n=1 Tax=Cetobacterium sp. TaxID=2071632 RepID=UPI003EE7C866